MVERDIFVVGAPRSGTTWLQRMLAAHPDVASPQETFFFSHYAAPVVDQFRRHERRLEELAAPVGASPTTDRVVGLPAVLTEDDVTTWLRAGWALVRQRTFELKPGATRIVEKSPAHAASIDLIREVCPGARFVHVIRDPRGAARSEQRAPWNAGSPADLLRSARSWQRLVRRAREAGLGTDDYVEVRYEALAASPADELAGVLEFAGLDADADRVEAMVADVADPQGKNIVVGGEAKRLGLGDEEPIGFDRNTRGEHPELSDFEQWLVLSNAGSAVELGYSSSPGPDPLRRALFIGRSVPVRLGERFRS